MARLRALRALTEGALQAASGTRSSLAGRPSGCRVSRRDDHRSPPRLRLGEATEPGPRRGNRPQSAPIRRRKSQNGSGPDSDLSKLVIDDLSPACPGLSGRSPGGGLAGDDCPQCLPRRAGRFPPCGGGWGWVGAPLKRRGHALTITYAYGCILRL